MSFETAPKNHPVKRNFTLDRDTPFFKPLTDIPDCKFQIYSPDDLFLALRKRQEPTHQMNYVGNQVD